jgi:hypothetical protein
MGTFTPFAMARVGGPVVADQTLIFGRLTAASAGQVTIANTGGSITSITLGTRTTGSNHFTTSAQYVLPSSVPSDAQYVWTGCTATGPQGTSAAFTLTINTVADAYSVWSDAQFSAAVTAIGTASGGARSILCRGVLFGTTAFSAKSFANIVTITRHSGQVADPVFTNFTINNTQKLTIDDIEVHREATSGSCFSITNGSDDIVITNCVVHGIYYDPDGDYSAGFAGNVGGIVSDGTTRPVDVTITNNHFYDLFAAVNGLAASGSITITGNTVENCFEDAFKIANAPTTFPVVIITGNDVFNCFASSTDTGNPHPDFIQFVGVSGPSPGSMTATVSSNKLIQPFGGRGTVQGIFSDNFPASTFLKLTAENNLVVCSLANGIRVNQADTCIIKNNTIVRPDAGVGANSSYAPNIQIGSSTTTGTHDIENNVSEAKTIAGSPTDSNNILLGTNGATVAYATAFDGLAGSFRPTSIADAVIMFDPKAAGPLDTTPEIGFTGP